jgi:hypothetical protein
VSDFNEISPSKLLRNNIKVKEKFCVVLVHSYHKSAHIIDSRYSGEDVDPSSVFGGFEDISVSDEGISFTTDASSPPRLSISHTPQVVSLQLTSCCCNSFLQIHATPTTPGISPLPIGFTKFPNLDNTPFSPVPYITPRYSSV